MRKVVFLLPVLFILSFTPASAQKTEFSQDSASLFLKTLVLDIGPRPMGSPAEQRALAFAATTFRNYGCDTSYVMPMNVAEGVNTRSGIAVGVHKGKSNRIIVIGGHIDSSGPDVPGANDDGSGSACVLELARVICKQETESTVLFCCWGGEEQGLRGSRYFVQHFRDIDSVVLMFQIDMADGAGLLQLDPDGTQRSAPSWLVHAAVDAASDSDKLEYMTAAATLNISLGGVFGSDHEAFIDKGIPAIDFTSDTEYPIHTPQDSWENFTPSGLQRSGDLVLTLFRKFDAGTPSRTTEQYQLVQVGSHLFFISYLVLWIFILLSGAVGTFVFRSLYKCSTAIPSEQRSSWSGFKLLCAAFVLQIFIWNAETVVGFINGYRYPWVNNTAAFTTLGIVSGLFSLWFILRLTKKFPLTHNPFVFARVAFPIFFLMTLLASLVTPELALFPALAMVLFSLVFLFRSSILKVIFFTLAFLVMYRLIFFDGMGLFQRLIAMNNMSKWWQDVLYETGFVIVFGILSLPFVYGFAAMYRDSGRDLFFLKQFRRNVGGLVSGLAVVAGIIFLSQQPVHGKKWFSSIRVEQRYTLGEDSSTVVLKGSEPLKGLYGRINDQDTVFSEPSNRMKLPLLQKEKVMWCDIVRNSRPSVVDSTERLERSIEIHSLMRPLRVEMMFESDSSFDVVSPWAHDGSSPDPSLRENPKRKRFVWYSFPEAALIVPVTFTMHGSQKVNEEITVYFDSLAYPAQFQREWTNVAYRTIVTARDTFSFQSHSPQ